MLYLTVEMHIATQGGGHFDMFTHTLARVIFGVQNLNNNIFWSNQKIFFGV